MTVQAFVNPFPTFTGLDGNPLSSGYVYFGQVGQDAQQYPKTVFWDEAMTSPATQPLRTSAGYIVRNGAPADVWSDGSCSVQVLDSYNRQVLYKSDWSGIIANAAAAAAAAALPYATAAAASATASSVSAAASDAARVLAEAARDLALGSAKVFTTTAQGIAATTNGQVFLLRTADLYTFDVYWNNATVATLLGQIQLASGSRFQQPTGSTVHGVFSDSAGLALGYWKDDGIYYKNPSTGLYAKLSWASTEVQTTSGTALAVSWETSDGTYRFGGISPDARMKLHGIGDVLDQVSASDHITAWEYESFGDTSKSSFFRDKAKNRLKQRVKIDAVAAFWDSDANVQGNREPWVLVLTESATQITGLVFFSQKNMDGGPHATGENGMRSAVRDFTVNLTAKTITMSTTRVIYQPAQWTNSPAGGWMVNPIAWKVTSGPNIGKIRLLLNTFDTTSGTGLLDNGDYYIVECLSSDNGQTWTAPVKVFGKEQVWDVLAGGTGGVPGAVPDPATGRSGCVTGTSNSMIRLQKGAHIGRIVVAINPLRDLTASWYQGCMYSDNEGDTWTRGTLFNPSIAEQYNEAQIVERGTSGEIVLFTRREKQFTTLNSQSRGMAVSTDGGATFGSMTINSTLKVGNCSGTVVNSSFQATDGFSKIIFGAPTDSRWGSRDSYAFNLSYDGGVNFIAKSALDSPIEGAGYGCLVRTAGGYYVRAYETFNGIDFWNVDNTICLQVFNEAELFANATLAS